ncbi:MAG: hypothetical protein A3I68_00010 [Candidatus Melainabacteria bacterium RIFCSPLOWO2_02_FULL_35_15]|nr:MAG: hypothetical protein A3F80_03060 [Candidatus Melainabacteria bacterium RIFCSPLOWO2_12_FULL_35_11]OGI14321.1 MAG: hypothetical protein A3I68_00010 [Candidatus Melainabacteria bacterium RIFCSPLOWO2_02_FULL_35_15]
MKLISSKKTKRRIALMFLFALMLSNLLSLVGPSAQAAVTLTPPATGTCFQHSGTVANGALVTVYNIGTIQLTLTASEINPGIDDTGNLGAVASTGNARATNAGSISTASDIIGNVFSFVPPTGTNFVVVPGFQDTTSGASNRLAAGNATISNAVSLDATSSAAGAPADNPLGISVGVVTAGTAGIGRAVVAIARDANGNSTTIGAETYPKSGTGSNLATITITGLGLAIPPSGNGALSGTLQSTLDASPPSGTAASGGTGTPAVAAAIPGLSGTLNLCTVASAAGQLEAVLDADDDATELYDKSGTSSANLLALGSISSNTRVWAFDTATLAGGVSATSLVDVEPILIKGTGTTLTGIGTKDQVIATAELLNAITTAALTPSGAAIDLTTNFNNSVAAPITIAFADDNASATTTLLAVDIIIESSTAGAAPAAAGFNITQSSRHGFLGALRAATFDSGQSTTNTTFAFGSSWGVVSAAGGPIQIAVQEGILAGSNATLIGAITANATTTEPQNQGFVDLRLECGSSTNPVAGWFAIANSITTATAALRLGTTDGTNQIIRATQAGNSFVVNSATTLYTQALTDIAGSNPISANDFNLGLDPDGLLATATGANALLYASCTNNTLTLVPIQNGFDNFRDIIAITPKLQVTNVSSTFASDVNLVAEISGNNLSGSTTLTLAKLVGALATSGGATSSLATAQGVGLASNSQLGVTCSSGGESSVVLSGVSTGTFDAAVTAACTSGAIASPSALFTGGVGNSVSGSTVVDGSPVVQGEGRGILIKEATNTGFNELVSQVGGGTQGTVFEVNLPSGCDVVDDRDDNNTAVSTTAATGGNDVTRTAITSTAGVTVAVTAGGGGDAALTNANVVEPATGATPAKLRFRLNAVGGAVDNAVKDAILLRLDSQDIFCPSSVTGELMGAVTAQNKAASPTVVANLGNVSFGTAKQAATFAFGDDMATSTKGEVSTNSMTGATPRLSGGGASVAHTFTVTEGDPKSIPIGGRTSARNLDPDNSVLSTVLSKGQLWIVPSSASAFSAAPTAADISFSDNSLVVDGNPLLVTSATVDANAPLGTIIIGLKKNTATGAADPATSTTTITVKNAQLTAAISSTTDLTASVEFFSQDGGVVVNTPGIASGNSASTPTIFTPFAPGSTKAFTQLNGATAATAAFQLGSGSLANQLLTARLTSEGTPQINPFAKVLAAGSLKNADASKITASATALSSGGSPATDNLVTVTGSAGSVDGGAQVVVTTGSSSTYDSTTVVASEDGSFTANLRGDCATATSVTVNVTEKVSGTSSTTATKTAVCGGSGAGQTADQVFGEIAGSDGKATISEVLSYVSSKGGLASIVSAGGNLLQGVIKAAKSALGLS